MIKLDVKITVSKEDYLDYVNELMALMEFLKDELMTLNLTDDKSAAIWKDRYITTLDQLACLNDDYQSLSDELDRVRDENNDLYDYLGDAIGDAYYDGVNTDDLIGRISYLHEVIEEAENERDDALGLNLTSEESAATIKSLRVTNQLLKVVVDSLRDELNYVYDNGTEDDNATIGKQDAIIKDLVATIESLRYELKGTVCSSDFADVVNENETLRDEYGGLEHDYFTLAERNNQLLDQLLNNQCDDDEEVVRKLERENANLKDALDAKHLKSATETFMDIDGFIEGIEALKDLLE